MANALHKAQTIIDGIHSPIAFEYANEAARLAAGPFQDYDRNKYALQLDTGVVYRLADPTTSTWITSAGAPVISGNLDMDGYDIIDVGLVDGVDISSHSGRHEDGGLDEIDGYQLSLVYVPTNYDPPINDILGEHIAAIDAAITGGGAVSSVFGRTGAVIALSSDYNASQIDNDSSVQGVFVSDSLEYLDGYIGLHVGDFNNPHNTSISNIGSGTLAELNTAITDATLDDISGTRTPTAHALSHEFSGGDEIDGYQLSVLYSPINYNPPINDVLGEHIAAIDEALAGSGGAVGGDLSGTLPNPSVIDLTISGEEQGSVLYFNGSNWAALDTSIDGYVLTTHGDGYAPTWEEASGTFTPDGKVLITITDGVSGYLEEKIEPGTGLTTEVLHDLTGVPLVRYYFDEAASGTTPTEVLDYAASPYDLPISYGDNLSYVEDTGRGIVGVATTNEGFVGVASFAGKLANINGGNTATFEFVVKSTTSAWGFLGVYGSDARRIEISHINSDISILIEDVGNFITSFTNGTARTYHIVIDSTQAGVNDKVKMYVNGVQVAVTIGFAPMPLNYTFNVAGKFGYMSRGDGDLDFQGTLYYAAVYEEALTQTQITANHSVLSVNNDHPTLENQKLKLSVGGFTGEEQGAVLYNNGTDWVALPTGSDGYVLTTHGDGANPTWSEADAFLWSTLVPVDGYISVDYSDYSGATVPLDGEMFITLNSPDRVGTFKMLLIDTVGGSTVSWLTESGEGLYALNGTITIANGLDGRSLLEFSFTGSEWYISVVQPMQVV